MSGNTLFAARSVTSESECDDDMERRLSRLSDVCDLTFKELLPDVTEAIAEVGDDCDATGVSVS